MLLCIRLCCFHCPHCARRPIAPMIVVASAGLVLIPCTTVVLSIDDALLFTRHLTLLSRPSFWAFIFEPFCSHAAVPPSFFHSHSHCHGTGLCRPASSHEQRGEETGMEMVWGGQGTHAAIIISQFDHTAWLKTPAPHTSQNGLAPKPLAPFTINLD